METVTVSPKFQVVIPKRIREKNVIDSSFGSTSLEGCAG